MLQADRRLRNSSDFQTVYRQRDSYANHYLVLYLRWRHDGRPARFGFSLSKKVGKAHLRNLYKRRLSEIIRLHWAFIPDGVDVVFIGRKALTSLEYESLQEVTLQLMTKGGIYHEPVAENSLDADTSL